MDFSGNPWDFDDEKRYGSARRVFSLANDLGYQLELPTQAEQQSLLFESYRSVKLLDLMQQITTTEDKLYEINREIGKIMMDRDTHDITDLSRLESRISSLRSLSSHLNEVVEKKGTLTTRLQQPYSGDSLMIDASLHKSVVEFFSMALPLLSDLSALLETISWTASNSKNFNSQTDQVITKIQMCVDQLKSKIDRMNMLRNTISTLHEPPHNTPTVRVHQKDVFGLE